MQPGEPEKYEWTDDQLALLDSDVVWMETLRRNAAKNEPAWLRAGQEVGIQIWHVGNYKVTELCKKEFEYGTFYNHDTYIILSTRKKRGHDVSACMYMGDQHRVGRE